MGADGFGLLGGVGLFLYGLQLVSGGLTQAAQSRLLRRPRRGGGGFWAMCRWAAAGVGITAVLQSSGAVTVFAVGAASAGLLPAAQAVALCWGANLGTTATGQLLRLGQGGAFGPAARSLLCLAGAAGALTLRGKAQAAAQAAFGLGLTFTGLAGVQAALAPLTDSPAFLAWLGGMQRPLPAFCFGAALAAGLQSSSGAMGLLQAAAAAHPLPWRAALPLMLGVNVGTCTTALAAALAAGQQKAAARQVAAGHLLFNLGGSAAAGLAALAARGAAFWAQPAGFGALANAHTAFNAATLALALGLAGLAALRPGTARWKGSGRRHRAQAPR